MAFSNIVPTLRTCLKDKIFLTGGRAGRFEFWVFTLFAVIVRAALYPLNLVEYLGILYAVVSFILFIAHYTALIRRLHDTNRGTHHVFPALAGVIVILIGFVMAKPLFVHAGEIVAVLGVLYLIVICSLKGTQGDNRYGPPAPIPS